MKTALFSTKIVPLQNTKSQEQILATQYQYNSRIMTNKKNIIFDFGGVIHDIRYENVSEAFARHGIDNLSNFYSKDFQTEEMDLFEKGMITPKQYRDYIRRMTGHDLSDSVIDEIVNAILIDVPTERVELLLQLRKKYHTYLFSNTNQINYDCFTSRLKQKFGFDIFKECFDASYFSHQMHCRKPDPEGFRRIVEEQGLNPSETVFVDDIAKNLEGAHAVGIEGIHLDGQTINDIFGQWI